MEREGGREGGGENRRKVEEGKRGAGGEEEGEGRRISKSKLIIIGTMEVYCKLTIYTHM